MTEPSNSPPRNGAPVFEPAVEHTYSLEVFSEMSGVSSHTILMYQQHGLLPHSDEEPASYNDDSLHALRRLECLRDAFSLNVQGLKFLFGLIDEVERLRASLRRRA